MQLRKFFLFLTFIFLLTAFSKGQKSDPPFIKYLNHPWVDSVLNTLSVNQKITQCIWIACWSERDTAHSTEIAEIIGKFGVGGIIFFQGTPEKQIKLTNYFQKISALPLLVAMDAEWGIAMRLNNVEKFPYQMTLGAIRNDSLIYLFGKEVAEQCKRIGVHINLAPVSDINNNPSNPVINYRSFGENRENVASKALLYMQGLQENGVMATAKHFPGHGDTDVDSHSDMPVIKHSLQRLDSLEFYPFKKLIGEGTGCIMTGHLNIPVLDTSSHIPSSLSPLIIKNLLRDRLGFSGLIITDAMNMKGITNYYKPGEAEARAFEAGNDVVEFVTDIEAALREINNEILLKKLTKEDLDQKCRKVLALKYWAGLNKSCVIDENNITSELNSGATKALIRMLYANALTLLKNDQNILPVRNLEKIKIAAVSINRKDTSLFQQRISKYQPADNYFINPSGTEDVNELLKKLASYDLVIAGVYGIDQRPDREYGITPELIRFLGDLIEKNKTVVTWFGNPYAIDRIRSLRKADGLLLTYQENDYTEDLAAQLIFGGIGARGSLPVSINEIWPYDFGILTPGKIRMQYGLPESAGMSSEILNKAIDSIVNTGLKRRAYPGCEVMVARKGTVVFQKTYGFHTYDSSIPICENDLFDLSSVTKISATLPGLMLLDTEDKFSPDETLGNYLPYFRKSNKGNLLMKEILAHQAGLEPWIQYWEKTVKKNGQYKRSIYHSEFSKKYPHEVASGLYITDRYREKIFKKIKKSTLSNKEYLYSDLGFIISPEIIELLSGEKWYDFITANIYHKIGAYDIGFNPWMKYPLSRIIPTEYDSLFRKQQVHGTVHDEGAAMLGGISGHAGLFATANDLMKLLEMYRRNGSYGGEQIIRKEVMEEYTRVQFPDNDNRRGLGFDKPLLNNSEVSPKDSNTARSASPSSFGHYGFTGTLVWVDPEYELSYIFLSNRVYPTRNNNLLTELNIRSDILQAIYDSIVK